MICFCLKSYKCSFKTCRSKSCCFAVFLVLFGSTPVMSVTSVRWCVAVWACVLLRVFCVFYSVWCRLFASV